MGYIMRHIHVMREKPIPLIMIMIAILFSTMACSSGHGGGVVATPESARLGFFLDAPVDGLQFSTPSWSGITGLSTARGYFYWEQRTYLPGITGLPGEQGTFFYQDGEHVTFSIGGVYLGSEAVKSIMTPVDLGTIIKSTADPAVINISRLLLTLDQDQNPDNGIQITGDIREALEDFKVNFSNPSLDGTAAIQMILDHLKSEGVYPEEEETDIISAEEAQIHLENLLTQIEAEEEAIAEEAQNIPLIASIGSPSGNAIMVQGQSLSLQGIAYGGKAPYSFSWYFEGEPPFSNIEDPGNRAFNVKGSYTLHFTVKDGADATREDSRLITVLGKETQEGPFLPDSAIVVNITSPSYGSTFKVGDTAHFRALLYNGNVPLYYNWTLGAVPGNSFVEGSEEVVYISPRYYAIDQGITLNSKGTYSISISVKDTRLQKLFYDALASGVMITVK
jgi:hypothetical protein